jgi:hypothetical protein
VWNEAAKLLVDWGPLPSSVIRSFNAILKQQAPTWMAYKPPPELAREMFWVSNNRATLVFPATNLPSALLWGWDGFHVETVRSWNQPNLSQDKLDRRASRRLLGFGSFVRIEHLVTPCAYKAGVTDTREGGATKNCRSPGVVGIGPCGPVVSGIRDAVQECFVRPGETTEQLAERIQRHVGWPSLPDPNLEIVRTFLSGGLQVWSPVSPWLSTMRLAELFGLKTTVQNSASAEFVTPILVHAENPNAEFNLSERLIAKGRIATADVESATNATGRRGQDDATSSGRSAASRQDGQPPWAVGGLEHWLISVWRGLLSGGPFSVTVLRKQVEAVAGKYVVEIAIRGGRGGDYITVNDLVVPAPTLRHTKTIRWLGLEDSQPCTLLEIETLPRLRPDGTLKRFGKAMRSGTGRQEGVENPIDGGGATLAKRVSGSRRTLDATRGSLDAGRTSSNGLSGFFRDREGAPSATARRSAGAVRNTGNDASKTQPEGGGRSPSRRSHAMDGPARLQAQPDGTPRSPDVAAKARAVQDVLGTWRDSWKGDFVPLSAIKQRLSAVGSVQRVFVSDVLNCLVCVLGADIAVGVPGNRDYDNNTACFDSNEPASVFSEVTDVLDPADVSTDGRTLLRKGTVTISD